MCLLIDTNHCDFTKNIVLCSILTVDKKLSKKWSNTLFFFDKVSGKNRRRLRQKIEVFENIVEAFEKKSKPSKKLSKPSKKQSKASTPARVNQNSAKTWYRLCDWNRSWKQGLLFAHFPKHLTFFWDFMCPSLRHTDSKPSKKSSKPSIFCRRLRQKIEAFENIVEGFEKMVEAFEFLSKPPEFL